MRAVHTSIATPVKVLVAVCAPLLSAVAARGETVNISNLVVFYTNQSASGAQGSVEFDIRFSSFDGPSTSYDAFSAQMEINQIVRGGPAVFTLDTVATENTSAVPEYWLPDPAPTDPLASTQNGEFRFRDRISLSASPVTPSVGDVLAHYVVGFDVGPGGFGAYQVSMGSPDSNFFSRSILPPTLNTLEPSPNKEDIFALVAPEPTSGLLVLFGGTMLLRRRRRRCRA
jgi:hypothetical protein